MKIPFLLKGTTALLLVSQLTHSSLATIQDLNESIISTQPVKPYQPINQKVDSKEPLHDDILNATEAALRLRSQKESSLERAHKLNLKSLQDSEDSFQSSLAKTGLSLDTKSKTVAEETLKILTGNTFLGRMSNEETSEEAHKLANKLVNMGAAVYDVDNQNLKDRLQKKLGAYAFSQVFDKAEFIKDHIQALQNFQKDLIKEFQTNKKDSIDAIYQRHLDKLSRIDSEIYKEINNSDKKVTSQDQVLEIITPVINKLQNSLKVEYLRQHQEYRKEVQEMINGNIHLSGDVEVVHVFTRNNGEFSGYMGYSKSENRLYVCFAGSKSGADWFNNLQGWNGGVSASSGLLQDLVFHSGFVKHFDEAAADFVETMSDWLKNYKQQNDGKTLEIAGAGHSLGGALAEMFTAATNEIAKKQGVTTQISVITSGAPANIAKATQGLYDDKFGGTGNVLHFANKYDPVPRLAFWRSNNAVARIQNGMDSLFFNHHKMFIWLHVNPHSSSDYSAAAPTALKEWQKYLVETREQAKKVIKGKEIVEKSENDLKVAKQNLQSYENNLEDLLIKQVDLNSSVYDTTTNDIIEAREDALDLVGKTLQSLKDNLEYYQSSLIETKQSLKDLKVEIENIDKKIKTLKKSKKSEDINSMESLKNLRSSKVKENEEQKKLKEEIELKVSDFQAKIKSMEKRKVFLEKVNDGSLTSIKPKKSFFSRLFSWGN